MSEHDPVEQRGDGEGSTSPDAAHPGEATSPPSNPEVDEEAVAEGEEKLDQASGGH